MTLTRAQLTELGYVVKDGVAVKDQLTEIENPDVTWQQMQTDCYNVFKSAGCEVWWLSQARRTGQTPGVPDLIVFGPPGHPFHLYWETKSGKGKLSPAQQKFALHCQRACIEFQSGSAYIARKMLKHLMAKHTPTSCGKCGHTQSSKNILCERCLTRFN